MIYRCPHCDGTFQASEGAVVRCPLCDREVRLPPPAPRGTAWDCERGSAWVDAFLEVVKESIANPVSFFQRVAEGEGWLRPWLFALIVSAAVFLVAAAYQAGFNLLASGAQWGSAAGGLGPFAALFVPFSIGTIAAFGAVAIPLGTTAALIVQAGVYHLCLMLLGQANRSFVATFRVVCYSMSPQLFQIIPLLGGLIAWGWQVALAIIGLKVAHETSYGRSAVAVFLPTILCCGAVVLLAAAIAGGAFAALLSAAK